MINTALKTALPLTSQSTPWSVTVLNQHVKQTLSSCSTLWIQGEISNLTQPRSGHIYFTLKDSQAQVACAWFKIRQQQHSTQLKEGLHVCVQARIGLYEPRGHYQLIIEQLHLLGEGALYQAFEQLKKELNAQGLFNPEHKKPLPKLPQTIGLITSPTGAAIEDISAVLKRRYPLARVILYPATVQGEHAPQSLVQALKQAVHHAQADVLILSRGGGAYEDLWGFNDASLAQQIFQCPIPIITGVGHETDTTIADFVADVRAPTPSAAAENCTPDQQELISSLEHTYHTALRQIQHRYQQATQHFKQLQARCQHPREKLIHQQQACDHLERILYQSLQQRLTHQRHYIHLLHARLMRHSPHINIERLTKRLEHSTYQNHLLIQQHMKRAQTLCAQYAKVLETLSPLKILARGYACVTDLNQNPITTAQAAQTQTHLQIHFHDEAIVAKIEAPTQD